jgi:hypothetical protein
MPLSELSCFDLLWRAGGDISACASLYLSDISEYWFSSGGVSNSGVNALFGILLRGNSGSDLLSPFEAGTGVLLAFLFFRRRAMRLSWQDIQNMPCEVRAYRRLSIFRLQLRHLKQFAQNAWSPVNIARSSILLLHALQLYVQLLQMSDPSPRRRRLASESRRVPQVLQRKQSICHRLPAVVDCQQGESWMMDVEKLEEDHPTSDERGHT